MGERASIVNISGDHEETVVQLAKHLGSNKIRRQVFDAIYGRGTRARSKKQIMEVAGIKAKGTNAQQVQNELDHLAKHHLIVRVENTGSVTDRSRYLYQKDPTVRANKAKIIKFANDRKAAEKVPTKRRPNIGGMASIKQITRQTLKKKKHLTVLYLVANPDKSSHLRVDAEIREVQAAIRGSKFRDNISVLYRPAADLDSLIDGLNDHHPQVVHFSGHGDEAGLATDQGKINGPTTSFLPFELLAKALSATDRPPAVIVLNSCNSANARKYILPVAKIVVSMRASITDIAASAFARRFYAAVASGQSIKAAFAQGTVAVEAVSIGEAHTPDMLCKHNVDPAKTILA